MQALFDTILPVFIVIGFGYAVAWRGLFSAEGTDALVAFTQNFAIPCLLFRAMVAIDLDAAVNAPLIASYYSGAFACAALGFLGARFLFRRNAVDSIAIGFACLFSNTVLLGLPITERAFGPDALVANYAIIAFHAPLCYLVGVSAMEIASARGTSGRRMAGRVVSAMFRNNIVIAIGLGVVVNLSGLPLPATLATAIGLLADAALPAALFGLGGVLYRYRPEGDLRTVLMVCGITLLVQPALVWGMGRALHLDQDEFRSAVLTAAMAPGVNVYVFANMYGAARRVAATSVLIATAASTVTIWLWLLVLP